MPKPLSIKIGKRVSFNEVDLMGVVWYGVYPRYFEEAAAHLGRKIGFSFREFYLENIFAPIVQFHVDYHNPLTMDEEFTIKASLIWSEAAKIIIEYELIKQNGKVAVTGYTLQMFFNNITKEVYLVCPESFEQFRNKWIKGEIEC